MTCVHAQTLRLSAKCDDRCTTFWPDGTEQTDFVPKIAGIGGGNYISIEVCVDCKELLHFEPDDVLDAQHKDLDPFGTFSSASCRVCGEEALVEYQFEENALVCCDCGSIIDND